MRRVFDPSSVCRILRHGIEQGYWTLEDLDRPLKSNLNPEAYRNPLRDEPISERVEVVSPRDLAQSKPFKATGDTRALAREQIRQMDERVAGDPHLFDPPHCGIAYCPDVLEGPIGTRWPNSSTLQPNSPPATFDF